MRRKKKERRERKVVEKIFSAFFHIFEQFDVHQSLAFETYNISIREYKRKKKMYLCEKKLKSRAK
jgi:hypothetical protein